MGRMTKKRLLAESGNHFENARVELELLHDLLRVHKLKYWADRIELMIFRTDAIEDQVAKKIKSR